ncbi:MAG: ATP-binding protein [Clostridia bacterium]|nr:ATP-binding protein [Clostridia bacterium]
MNYIDRALESTFIRLSGQFSALLLTGPRQAGKTTMLQRLAAQEGNGRGYVTLDDLQERQLAKSDPAMFFQIHKPPLLIDEVQYAPELFPYIKIHVDRYQRPGDFWLTGSQVFRLMDGVRESLAGRVALLQMLPLSQSEILGRPTVPFFPDPEILVARSAGRPAADVTEIYQRIFNGGMPALISGRITDRQVLYSSYIGSYIERDVRELSGTIDALRFMTFMTAAAALAGQLLNYRTLAEASEIDQTTAKRWLRILETLGIVFYLHPYSNNLLKRTIKSPKLYFQDTGLVCHLTHWSSPETLMNGAMSGALLENHVVSEIVKSYRNVGREPFLYYYRDKDAREIDLVLEENGALYPIEIKKTSLPDPRISRVFGVLDRVGKPRGRGAVVCAAEKLGALDRDTLVVPVDLI